MVYNWPSSRIGAGGNLLEVQLHTHSTFFSGGDFNTTENKIITKIYDQSSRGAKLLVEAKQSIKTQSTHC
jgi:hypothetical protein